MNIEFLGIGSAWNINYDNTSAYIKKDKKMILMDCGESIARKIIHDNILDDIDELYILISHTHSDHIGSLGTLLFYSTYNKGIINNIVLPNNKEYINNLKAYLKLVDISSEVKFIDANTLKETFKFKTFDILKATHVKSLPCYCFVFEDEENLIYYSADNSNIEYIKHFLSIENAKIYTEISDNPELSEEHLELGLLEKATSVLQRKRIYLMHINESLSEEELRNKGFNIPITRKKDKIMEEKIKLNKQGYEEYLKEIEKKEKQLADLRMYKGTDAIFQGDNWHDNPTLYQTELQEMSLMREITEMRRRVQNIEIVENVGNEELVDIGDIVKIDMIFSEDDREEELFKLVATAPNFDLEIKEVSINSPIGNAMYHKKVGEIATYKVQDRIFTLQIKEKVVLGLEQEEGYSKKKNR